MDNSHLNSRLLLGDCTGEKLSSGIVLTYSSCKSAKTKNLGCKASLWCSYGKMTPSVDKEMEGVFHIWWHIESVRNFLLSGEGRGSACRKAMDLNWENGCWSVLELTNSRYLLRSLVYDERKQAIIYKQRTKKHSEHQLRKYSPARRLGQTINQNRI